MRRRKKSWRGKRRNANRRRADERKTVRKSALAAPAAQVGASDAGGTGNQQPATRNSCAQAAVAGGRRLDLRDVPLGCDGLAKYEPDLERGTYAEVDFHGELNSTCDPPAVLRRACGWLAPGGTVRARFVNARHIATIGALVSGKWSGQDKGKRGGGDNGTANDQRERDGILTNSATGMIDANPKSKLLRFYTRREIEKLFYRSGYELTELRPEPNPSLDAWRRAGCPLEVAAGALKIAALSPEEAEEFLTEQFVAVARDCGLRIADCGLTGTNGQGPNTNEQGQLTNDQGQLTTGNGQLTTHDSPLTSIIIVTHNELAFTRMCLESVRFFTDEPYELIMVDNGSTDGTVEFLRASGDVRLIENAGNRGFPAACNQGILASRGEYILLLNNDVIVTTGWLRRMLAALGSDRSRSGIRQNSDADQQGADAPRSPGNAVSRRAGIPCSGIRENSNVEDVASTNDQGPMTNDSSIGLVGACSNAVSGEQQINVGYEHLTDLDGWAWEWGRANHGQRMVVERLIGFCLLFRRKLVGRIGLFDERFGIGNFEDDDYCLRAKQAGYQAVIARDAFVHHFGHRTFAGAGIDLNALLLRNKRIFQEKWADSVIRPSSLVIGNGQAEQMTSDQGQLTNSNPRSEIRSPQSSTLPSPHDLFISSPCIPSPCPPNASVCNLSPKTCSLSCCMIVRDNESTIEAAVTSILPWVGEVVVVDTGSTDRTAEICRELGCRVYHMTWPDSFAVARNESLKYARGEWIFWMDSDDVIDAENGRKLAELVGRLRDPKIMGVTMKVLCPSQIRDGAFDFTAVDHCKVFRNRHNIRFVWRIHEQVMESINNVQGDVIYSDLYVVHAGADQSPEGRRAKLRRDIRLLCLERRENPDHPFLQFNFGMTYADAGKHRKAIRALRRSLELAQPHESHVRKVYALLAGCYRDLGDNDAAQAACRDGLKLFPKDPELLFRHAALLHDDGRLRLAEQAYRAALANDDAPHFASFDYGIVGYKARQNLAVVYNEMGALDKAEAEWRQIVGEVPAYRHAWHALAETMLAEGKPDQAQQVAHRVLSEQPALAGTAVVIAAKVAESSGKLGVARFILEGGVRECPADTAPLEALCELLFYHAPPAEAVGPLAELARRQPADAGVRQNLGTVLLSLGRCQEAIEAFQASLQYRPEEGLTYLSLGYALSDAGRLKEAAEAFRHCSRLAPGEPIAAEAERRLEGLSVSR